MIVNTGLRRTYGLGTGIPPTFAIEPARNPTIAPIRGTAASFTRATIASIYDWEGVCRQVLSGEARFGGLRRVQNLVAVSQDLTNGAWTSAGTGSKTATTITFTNSDYTQRINVNGGVGNGKKFVVSFKAYIIGAASAAVRFETVDSSDGSDAIAITPTLTTTPTRYSFAADYSASATITNLVFFINRGVAVTAGTVISFSELQAEEITGQSNTNPSEYVSTAVLSAPYQGANVDGVQYFAYQNGNTVASNVVTEALGAMIPDQKALFLGLSGISGAYASTPDSVANSITGRIGIRFRGVLPDWTPAVAGTALSKLSSGVTRSFRFYPVNTAGFPGLEWSTDGSTTLSATATTAVSFADGTIGDVFVDLTPNNGAAGSTCIFYTSNNDGLTWTQLGTTVVGGTAGSIFDSTSGLEVGTSVAGIGTLLIGNAFRVQLYNGGLNGTLVADFNPTLAAPGAGSFVAATGETWTINGSAKLLGYGRGGYLPEPAATDLLNARADARDMTTANWTLGATMTRARTSVGWDGVANKATRLTGGAAAATNIITTTITAAASSRTYSVGIKRVTGTGPVRITQDNFATNTDISSLINSSTYTLVQLNQSQLNAVLGIKIDTNGDAIDADWNQFSAGNLTGLVNSRIPDTITTRNADSLTYATTGWLNASAGTLYTEFFNPNNSGNYFAASIHDGTANNTIGNYAATTTQGATQVWTGGVQQEGLSVGGTLTAAATGKIIHIWQANDFASYSNGTTLGTDVAGTIPTVTTLQIGGSVGLNSLGSYVRKVANYPIRMRNGTAQALTT